MTYRLISSGTRFNGAASLIEAEEKGAVWADVKSAGFNGAASLIEAEAQRRAPDATFSTTTLQRGRLVDRGGGCRAERRRSALACFNGAASLIEAEDAVAGYFQDREVAASTGPPR